MSSPARAASGSVVLALMPRKGMVRMCPAGCFHVTYGCVTLDFHCRRSFEGMIAALRGYSGVGSARVFHGNAVLTLSEQEHAEHRLIEQATEALRHIDAVKRLLPEEPPASQ